GSRTAVVGPSGSGKTTLLRVVAGFDRPDDGRIVLDGTVLHDGIQHLPTHRRGVGVVMQDGALFPHLTVGENIGFGLPRETPDRARRIATLAEQVGLDASMLPRRPDALSGGQQQRVALARALARQPRLMLLDEPFSALDTALRASTRQMVADVLGAAGITTVLVTHDQAEALSFADQVAVMAGGRLLQAGTPRELYFHPRAPLVARFLGDAVILSATVADGVARCALGAVPVSDRAARGQRQIMLRPEQLVVAEGGAVRGVVEQVAFNGPFCSIALRLPAHPEPLALRQSALAPPAPGTEVGLSVQGVAHVFAAEAGAAG
ncbi:MAG: ABC transporter ATP-binding protein, partial [Rhodospirillales bacterium]|nr:ABC transporter ATP-binding protein [Rhodospirillales bacterium]